MRLPPLLLALAVAAPLPAQDPAPVTAPEVGGPAPAHGLTAYATDAGTDIRRSADGTLDFPVNGGHAHRADLADLEGHVVLLHVFDPASDAARTRSLPLVRDLMTANADRGIAAVSLVPPQPDAAGLRESLAIPWPVAVWDADSRSPYLADGLPREDRLWVVDRCGRIAWTGNPATQERELLEVMEGLLAAPAAPPLTRRLDAALDDAVEAYLEGRWQEAREAAEKAAKRADAEAVTADARLIVDLVAAQLQLLQEQVARAAERNRALTLLRLQATVRAGFPDSDLRTRLDDDLRDRRRRMGAGTIDDAEALLELLEDRPVLFPARRSRKGDKLQAGLEKLLKRSNNDIQPTQLARWLLDRYAAARDAD